MMKKIATLLLISTTLMVSHHATAQLIYPGKLSNFDDGNADGWAKGARSNAQPQIKTDQQGNQYLEVSSVGELTFEGERDPDSRLKVLNHTSWVPDYDVLGIIAIKVRMTNLGNNPLHMRLFFGNMAQEKMCMTESAVKLNPDKQWQDIVFSLEQPGLICGTIGNNDRNIQPAAFSLEELKKNITNIFFISLETPDSDGKLVGTLGIDNIEALTYPSLGFVESSKQGKQLAILDLHTDVVANSELIQHISNTPALTNINNVSTHYQLNENTGMLKVLSEGKIEFLRPVSAVLTEQSFTGTSYSESGYKQIFTTHNRRMTAFPQSNAEDEFKNSLQTLGLQMEHDGEGNLAVFPTGGNLTGAWYSVRVDSVSTPSDGTPPTGISAKQYNNLVGVSEYIHHYTINTAVYQQSYHSVPADWEALKNHLVYTLKATHVRLSPIGVINLTIAGVDYTARIDALVKPQQGDSLPEKVELAEVGDINKDGLTDFKLVYTNGQSQIIYLLP